MASPNVDKYTLAEPSPLLADTHLGEVIEAYDNRADRSRGCLIVWGLVVLLTMGGNGAFFTDGEKVWRASAVKVDVLSATCAGDATLAAFLSRWFADRKNVEQALRRAMATGANVAMCAGLGDFALVDELEGRVVIEQAA